MRALLSSRCLPRQGIQLTSSSTTVFVLPTRLFFEFVVFRWFSPIVQHVGRPLVAHFFIKLVHFNVTRSVPAQIRILVNSTRSYALAHATPTFLKAGKGWARKVEVNGTKGWWIGDSKNDKSKDDVVVYFIHGGAFLCGSSRACASLFCPPRLTSLVAFAASTRAPTRTSSSSLSSRRSRTSTD